MHISYPGDVAVGLSELGTSRLVVARVVVVLLLYMGPYDYCSISSMPTCVRKLNLFHKIQPCVRDKFSFYRGAGGLVPMASSSFPQGVGSLSRLGTPWRKDLI